jgi:hypothetical protein
MRRLADACAEDLDKAGSAQRHFERPRARVRRANTNGRT